MRYRACLYAVLLTLFLPTFLVAENERQDASKTAEIQEIATMDNMRSIVPSLVALGWNDFFLGRRNELGLTPSQAQELLSLRLEFAVATEQVKKYVEGAELELYEELDQNQVSVLAIESQARWVSGLRGEFVVLRLRYLLRAINVLSHEQHLKLAASLKLQTPQPPDKRQQLEPRKEQSYPLSAVVLQLAPNQDGPQVKPPTIEENQCSTQPAVSVEALVSYEQGRRAGEALMKLADKLRKLAESRSSSERDGARKLAAQMQPELWSMEWSSQMIQSVIVRGHDEQFAELRNRLRTEPVNQDVTEITQELRREVPNATAVARQAKQLKERAKQWRKAVKRAAEKLCLKPVPVLLGTQDRTRRARHPSPGLSAYPSRAPIW